MRFRAKEIIVRMDAVEFIVRQIHALQRQIDATMEGMTAELFHWQPPGVTNAIHAIFLHLNSAEDRFIQSAALGQLSLWERDGWKEKIGIHAAGRGNSWAELHDATSMLPAALAYQTAVRAATEAYLAALTPEELTRKIQFLGAERSIADMLTILVVHGASHAGEIAALKGVQGVKGLGF